MQPLPLPVRGGSIDSLAPFLNLASKNDFVLVVAWLLGALRAGGPYPVLAIAGEQGSAKTVLTKVLRAVIDPSVAPVRALPRDESRRNASLREIERRSAVLGKALRRSVQQVEDAEFEVIETTPAKGKSAA
jgi:hypothetical protein